MGVLKLTKIAFIQEIAYEHLGTAYLSAVLKKAGHQCNVFVTSLEKNLIDKLKEAKPDLIAFSVITGSHKWCLAMARKIKDEINCKVIFGGPHATHFPEVIKEEAVDYVCRGEGEEAIVELADKLGRGEPTTNISGIWCKKDGEVIRNDVNKLIENIDSLPFPDRDAYYKYKKMKNNPQKRFLTARGCPYDCIFCASKVAFGRRVRYRSVENIISEMEECITKYGTNHFSILDDTFTFKKDILYPVCDYLRAKKLTWDCFTRVDRVDEEIIRKVVDSGCEKISFGLESGSERILRLINKNISVSQIKEACRICRKAGLRYLETTFMIGNHPLETMEDIDATITLIREIDPDLIALSITSPFPGTELNRIMKEGGYINTENWDEFVLYGSRPSWRYEYLTIDKLKDIQRRFTRSFYLRANYIVRQLRKIKTLKEFLYWSRLAIDTVKAF